MTIRRRTLLQLAAGSLFAQSLGCGSTAKKKPSHLAPVAPPKPDAAPAPAIAKSCILLYMAGGPSQMDTFDPKPGAKGAAGVGAISTNVDGIRFAEHLPKLGKIADRLAVIRSLRSKEGSHQRAFALMHTGYVPQGQVRFPSLGSLLASERATGDLPGYVSVNGPGARAGFLSPTSDPFVIARPDQATKNLARHQRVSPEAFAKRLELWRALEDDFAKQYAETPEGMRLMAEQAVAMMESPAAAAFDLSKEPEKSRARYGDGRFALGCLMARRLVEVGVPFIEVALPGWDTHREHSAKIGPLCAELDHGMSSLLVDLEERGLLESTLVVWMGDFGRTPVISERGGRDHYPAICPVVVAGGGAIGGQVIGETDPEGVGIMSAALSIPDLMRSVAPRLGLDPDKRRQSRNGRPIATVDGGQVIAGLFR